MTEEVRETYSEDYGFKLCTPKDGIKLFPDKLDLDSITNPTLSLLSIANKSQLFAASNSSSIVIDKLSKLNSDEQLRPDSFTNADKFSNISHVAFNHDESQLYVLSNHKLYAIGVTEFLSDASTSALKTVPVAASFQINDLKPSPTSNCLLLLTESQELVIIVNNSVHSKVSQVTSFNFSLNGERVLYSTQVSKQATVLSLVDGSKIEIPFVDDLEPTFSLSSINEVITGTAWLTVFSEKEKDDEDARIYIIVKDSDSYKFLEAFIASPSGIVPRSLTFYVQPILNWLNDSNLFLVTSSRAIESNSLLINKENNEIESLIPDIDTNQPTYPINDDSGDDASVVGFAVDLSNTAIRVPDPCTSVDEATGKLPKSFVLSHEGTLIGWWVFEASHLKAGTLSLESAVPYQPSSATISSEPTVREKDDLKTEFLEKSAEPSNAEPKSVNPFGSSSSDAFKSSFNATATENPDLSTLNPLSSTSHSQPAPATGFGSSGFGSSSFGASSKSPWGTVATSSAQQTSSGFGQYSTSGFGGLSNNSNSIFSTDKKESNQGPTSSPFASLGDKPKASPFGSLGEQPKASPFGSLSDQPKESPFASLGDKPKESPFGSLGDKQKAPPFGSLGEKPKSSPFASLGEKPKTDSPFGSLAKSSSPFGSLGNQPKPESPSTSSENDKAKSTDEPNSFSFPPLNDKPKQETASASLPEIASPLGSQAETFKSTPITAPVGLNKDQGVENKPHSQFAKTSDSTFASFAKPAPSTETKKATTTASEAGNSLGGSGAKSDSFSLGGLGSSLNETSKPFFSSNREYEPNGEESPVDDSHSDSESARSVLTVSDDEFNDYDVLAIRRKAGGRLFAPKDSRPTQVNLSSESFQEISKDDLSEYESSGKSKTPTLSISSFEQLLPPASPDYLIFDGFKNHVKSTPNSSEEVIKEIGLNTLGHVEIFKRNLQTFSSFMDHQLHNEAADGELHLSLLSKVDSIKQSIAEDVLTNLKELKDHQNQIDDTLQQLNEARDFNDVIDKLISQLKVISDKSSSNREITRKLDPQQEYLRKSIRRKYSAIQSQIDLAHNKLIPFKAKKELNKEMLNNLGKVIFEVNRRAVSSLDSISSLQNRINVLSLEDKPTVLPIDKHLPVVVYDKAESVNVDKQIITGKVRIRTVV